MNEIQSYWEIPNFWQWAKISELGKVVSGGTPSTKEPTFWGPEINWISPSDLSGYSGKFISKGAKSLTRKGLNNSSAKVMPAGSVHFSSRAPIGYVVISAEPMSTNQGFKSLVPAQGVFNEYIFYYLKSAKRIAEDLASGTTFKELSGKAFSQLPVPLPPLNEQKRIVAKIEALFAELDAGVASLKKAQAQLKTYRQALLKHAFSGKLTEQWRAENGDKLEDGPTLLQRIRAERQARYVAEVAAWEENGRQGQKPRPPKDLPPLTPAELEELPQLPAGWAYIKLGQIAWSVKDGPHYSPKYVNEGIPFLSGGNVRPQGVDFENVKYISKELHEELCQRCKPEYGDILYTKGGTTGIARVNTYKHDFNVWVHVAVLKLIAFPEPFYVQHVLNAPFCYSQSQKYTHGVGNQDLGLTRMVNIILPICCQGEQREIIKIIDEQMSSIDQLEQTIITALQQAEALRQSILKKAFSGQLVPQDPADEPAAVLLARIRAAKP